MSAPALMAAQPIGLKSKELRSKSPPAVGHPSKAPTLLWCCAHIIFLEYLEKTSGSWCLRPPPGELEVERPTGAKLMSQRTCQSQCVPSASGKKSQKILVLPSWRIHRSSGIRITELSCQKSVCFILFGVSDIMPELTQAKTSVDKKIWLF